MKVRFTKDVVTKEEHPQTFKKDEVVDFFEMYSADPELKDLHGDELAARARVKAQASARHWVNRGAAVEVKEETQGKAVRQAGRTPPPEPKAEAKKPAGTQTARGTHEEAEPGTFTAPPQHAGTVEAEGKDHGKKK